MSEQQPTPAEVIAANLLADQPEYSREWAKDIITKLKQAGFVIVRVVRCEPPPFDFSDLFEDEPDAG